MKLRTLLLAIPLVAFPVYAYAQDGDTKKDGDDNGDNGDGDGETHRPKKKAKATPPPDEGGTAPVDANAPDHDKMAGHLAVGFMQVSQLPFAQVAGTTLTKGSVTTPFIGMRYWINKTIGIDAGLGFGLNSASATTSTGGTSTTTDQPTVIGLGLHGGLPIAFVAGKHYTFELIPEFNFGFTTATLKNAAGGPDTGLTGIRFDLGARIGSEIHFGFIGVPELALQATIGLGLRFESVKASLADGSFSASISQFGLATSVQDAPWAIFTNTISALYYF